MSIIYKYINTTWILCASLFIPGCHATTNTDVRDNSAVNAAPAPVTEINAANETTDAVNDANANIAYAEANDTANSSEIIADETQAKTPYSEESKVIFTLPDDFTILPPSPYLTKTDECPKGAYKTKDGECSCYYGSVKTEKWGKHEYGELKPDGSEALGGQFTCTRFWFDDPPTGAICENPKGCRALDGRIFPALKVERDFYVPGGMDTTLDAANTNMNQGVCVLDRTDGIPLYSTLKDMPSVFACDRPSCPCGANTCRNGELCRNGSCQYERPENAILDETNSIFVYKEILDPTFIRRFSIRADKYYEMMKTPEGRYQLLRSRHDITNSAEEINMRMFEKCMKHKSLNCAFDYSGDFDFNHLGIRAYDSNKCPGGKFYCHGKGNFPLPKPNNPDGYYCHVVKEVPNYLSDLPIMAWTCGSRECECGGHTCPWRAACIHETCLCGKDVVQPDYSCQWICNRKGCDDDDQTLGLVCEAESCKCGETQCKKDEICRKGACLEAYINR